ncbi:MAG: GSCFA domain-containing protein [Paludibacter sp.]|nr:GSCFA domain-containing protein [Paludibacter sp.]
MFTTKVKIEPSVKKITYESRLITLGSCFSEHIGQRLNEACFLVDANPFGVLFNPVSIKNSVVNLIENKHFTVEDLFLNGSLWSSFSHSTLFSSTDAASCLNRINSRIETAHAQLLNADYLLITFGTAWVYELKQSGEVVSNCHKLPAEQFQRRRLTVEEIVSDYAELFNRLRAISPGIEIIFTVSPIRHWKDGAHENNISKSILHLAVEALTEMFDFVSYFPAYEIQLDELRDYRFYDSDMFHPNDVAVDYIWKRFSETYFTDETNALIKRLANYYKQMQHRPIHQESKEHAASLKKLDSERNALLTQYPFLSDRLQKKSFA